MTKKRILVVDDEPAMTSLARANLERTGLYEVRTENQAWATLAAAREFRPDLILLDVMMPGMLGSEVAAQLDADAELSKTKYVFLTCMVTRDEANLSHGEIGGHVFMAKPINVTDLCRIIEEQLQA